MSEYRVNLDVYNGPLDLLLYLIRRDELDIYDIPISRITEQYINYVEILQQLDPNLAGEFLVMAATLMEVKTRLLLPTPTAQEGPDTGVGIDPRTELIRQLLEYKSFKDAAAELSEAAIARAQQFARSPAVPGAQSGEFDLEDVQVWDLLDAFNKLMASIGSGAGQHQVIYDDTPVELHAADIVDRLGREGALSFRQIFEGRTVRDEIVGLFLALLELVRQKRIAAIQDSNFGDIRISLVAQSVEEAPAAFADSETGTGLPLRASEGTAFVTNKSDESAKSVPIPVSLDGPSADDSLDEPTADAPAPAQADQGQYIASEGESKGTADEFDDNSDDEPTGN